MSEPFKNRPGVPLVFLAMPHYDGTVNVKTAAAYFSCAVIDDSIDTVNIDNGGSLLARTFNQLWCAALDWHLDNPGQVITHFAMLHADVIPEAGWLRKLMDELHATDADLISAIVAIKNDHGLTSTAISSGDPWRVKRRLTMSELMALPETIDAEACGYPGETILANTGCWLARFDKLWKECVHFEINDRIVKEPDGRHKAETEPEDWNFSKQIARHGGKIVATRKVKVDHVGMRIFPNDRLWGNMTIDHMANGETLPALEPISLNARKIRNEYVRFDG